MCWRVFMGGLINICKRNERSDIFYCFLTFEFEKVFRNKISLTYHCIAKFDCQFFFDVHFIDVYLPSRSTRKNTAVYIPMKISKLFDISKLILYMKFRHSWIILWKKKSLHVNIQYTQAIVKQTFLFFSFFSGLGIYSIWRFIGALFASSVSSLPVSSFVSRTHPGGWMRGKRRAFCATRFAYTPQLPRVSTRIWCCEGIFFFFFRRLFSTERPTGYTALSASQKISFAFATMITFHPTSEIF